MLSRLREFRRVRDEYGDVQARWLVPGGHALDVAARALPWLIFVGGLAGMFVVTYLAVVR